MVDLVKAQRVLVLVRLVDTTVSLYKLEDKQKPRTKLSMYPINMHIGEPKTAFTKILAAYGFLKIGFKVLKQL